MGNRIPVTVEVVEYRGREQSAQLRTAGGRALHARTDRRLAPSWISDLCLWLAFVLISAVALYAVKSDVWPFIKQLLAPK